MSGSDPLIMIIPEHTPGTSASSFGLKKEFALYGFSNFKFTSKKTYFQLDCRGETLLQKKEIISLLQFIKKIIRKTIRPKLLVTCGPGCNVDIETWSFLSRFKFSKQDPLKIAFVAISIHHKLLLNYLGLLNKNMHIFPDKLSAVKWLAGTKK